MSCDKPYDIQNQALCDNERTLLETWLSLDHAFAQGQRHEVKCSQR